MNLIQKPTLYSFAGNILDIVVNSDVDVAFVLILNGVEQLRERYSPDGSDRVVIRLGDIVERITPEASIEAGVIDIPTYTYRVGNLSMETFRCIRGGHGASTDAATFMRSNWLSWQPQSRTTGYHTPQRLCYAALTDCTVKVRGYFADNSTADVDLMTLMSDKLYTIDTTFGTIRGRFGKQPTSFDIWVEGGGVRSYTQRYYITSDGANDDVFMWYGSLGGVETAIFTGDRVEKSEIESMAAVFDDKEIEFDRNGKKLFTKYTGYIASDNTRLWLLDFFNSIHRYHIDGGALRRVVVSKPKLEHTRGELAGYEFTFAHSVQSKYINLPRAETPAVLEMTGPAGELFFLAPRLNEFSRGEFGAGDILIPCQYAAGGDWLSVALIDILEGAHGGGGGGGGVTKVRGEAPIGVVKNGDTYTISHHIMPPTDVFGHSGTADRYGHCIRDPHPYGGDMEIDFMVKRLIAGEIVSTDFVSGLLGDGFKIDANGNAEFGSLMLRTFLMTPELIKNRIRTVSGDVWFSDSAVVSAAAADPVFALTAASGARIVDSAGRQLTTTYRGYYHIAVRDSEGKPLMTFAVDDILRGIYSYEDGTFETVFLRVTTALRGSYLVRPLNGLAPAADMVLVRQGNYTNPLRQNAVYVSAMEGYVRVLGGVNDVAISLSNIKAQAGNLRGLHLLGVDNMPPDGLYAPGLVIHSSSVLGLDTTLTATADKLALQGETITAQARQIELKADQVTVDGLLTVNGQIRADKIDTDSLVAKSIDTRDNSSSTNQRGFVFGRGVSNIQMYDSLGVQTGSLIIGESYEGGVTGQLYLWHNLGRVYLRPYELVFASPNGQIDNVKYGNREIVFYNNGEIKANYSGSGIALTRDAQINMPGVLAAGHVEKTEGKITGQWGCKSCQGMKYNGQVGQYKIDHYIGHLDYYATATPTNSEQWNNARAVIKEKTTTYIVVAMYDINSADANVKSDFEFMICGKN